MPVLFRWIFLGCLNRSLATMAALLAIYAIIEAFDKARYLGQGLNASLLIEYLLLKCPFMISEFMPIIVLIAASLYLIELSRHQEVVAVRAAGLGINKLLTPLLSVALLASLFSFMIGEWITPATNQRLDVIEQVHINHKKAASHGVQWLRDGHRFFRLSPLEKNQFGLMLLETDQQGSWLKRTDAARASYVNGTWKLHDVQISSPSEAKSMNMEHLKELDIPSSVGPETGELPQPGHMQFMELYNYIAELRHAGLSSSSYNFALHRKLSAPLACILMVILAAALCMQNNNRSGRASWGMIAAISLGLVFYVMGNASSLLAVGERLPAAYAAWLPNLAFGGLSVFLLLQREGH